MYMTFRKYPNTLRTRLLYKLSESQTAACQDLPCQTAVLFTRSFIVRKHFHCSRDTIRQEAFSLLPRCIRQEAFSSLLRYIAFL